MIGATLTYAVVMIVLFGIYIALSWQGIVDYVNWAISLNERALEVDPNNPFAAVMPPPSVMALLPGYFLFLIIFYLVFAAYEAACLKWMIRGEVGGVFGLMLNADTWRVYFTYWLWYILLMVVYLACAICVFAITAGAVFGMQATGADMNAVMIVAPLLLVFAIFGVIAVFAVRFGPAAATSIASRRFAFFDAWKVTRGRFWSLLGSYVLLFLMYFVGICALSVGLVVILGGVFWTQFAGGAETLSPEALAAMLAAPGVWMPVAALYAVMIAGAFVFYVALFGVNARAAALALEEGKIQAA
jgi:hypothetical protein